MQVYFRPVDFVDVAASDRRKRNALLRAIERRMYDFIPPDETDEDGKTHEEQQREFAKDQRALARMKVRATPKAPREDIEEHISVYRWLSDNGFMSSFHAAMPCPSPTTVFAIADGWQKKLIAMLPVDDEQGPFVQATADIVDAMRDWAARGFSVAMFVN